MKRIDLRIGQELALAPSNDWADTSEYGIRKVTVIDTRAFTARRGGYRSVAHPPLELEDGTQIRGDFYALSPGKATCLVNDGNGVKLVQISQLRGDYAECLTVVRERSRIRAQAAAQRADAEADLRARVQVAAAALKDLGVPIGYVSAHDQRITLGAAALEKIVELLSAQG